MGTIFEEPPIGLDKWLTAVWMIANCQNGVSSYEIHRAIKVTQKTAWFMLHRIRLALHSGTFEKLSGTVEVDEMWVGGKVTSRAHKSHSRDPYANKTAVAGAVERGGRAP